MAYPRSTNKKQIFQVAKKGHSENSSEDYCATNDDVTIAAIADGVSISYLSKEWAKILVDRFCQNTDSINQIHSSAELWLEESIKEWDDVFFKRQKSPDRNWFDTRDSTSRNASSTFLGLRLRNIHSDNTMDADIVAVGDTCLIQIRDRKIVCTFPIQKSDDFKSTPQAFSTDRSLKLPQISSKTITCEKDDILLLVTDALAKWILSKNESSHDDWKKFLENIQKDQFDDYIITLRSDFNLEDDDTTLCKIIIQCGSAKRKNNNEDSKEGNAMHLFNKLDEMISKLNRRGHLPIYLNCINMLFNILIVWLLMSKFDNKTILQSTSTIANSSTKEGISTTKPQAPSDTDSFSSTDPASQSTTSEKPPLSQPIASPSAGKSMVSTSNPEPNTPIIISAISVPNIIRNKEFSLNLKNIKIQIRVRKSLLKSQKNSEGEKTTEKYILSIGEQDTAQLNVSLINSDITSKSPPFMTGTLKPGNYQVDTKDVKDSADDSSWIEIIQNIKTP